MPVTKGTYSNNETTIYHFLINNGLNTAAACGILANLYAEGGFNPRNLQDSYESSLGHTDDTYTKAVDSGSYKRFSKDSAGYGIAQWTFSSRKANLLKYAQYKKTSIGNLNMQLEFLFSELKTDYSSLWNRLRSVNNDSGGAYNAGFYFCSDFERPAGGTATANRRGVSARDEYWKFYSNSANTQGTSYAGDTGSTPPPIGGDAIGSLVLSSTDAHAKTISQNLSRVEAEGYDYGYLIDLDHGGEFKFYIPEFNEAAGAQWSPVDIRGRSVSVQSYESTSSRTITVSLDLYAGAGLYNKDSGDVVSELHKDANFVKSLEYPDYTTAITGPPPRVQLILGAAMNISGIVSGVTVEHLKPLDRYNRSMYIKLSFTVTQVAKNPPDYRDIRAGQYTLSSTADIGSLLDVSSTYVKGTIPTSPSTITNAHYKNMHTKN